MKESPYLEGQNQVIRQIRLLPIFRPYNNAKIKDLLRFSKIRQYEPNEVIIEEGSIDKLVYFMLSGSVQIEKSGSVLAKLQKNGDVFGELGFLNDGPRSSNVRATKDTSCLAVDVSHLHTLQKENNDSLYTSMYKMFAQILAQRLRETTEKYDHLKNDYARLKGTA